MFLSITRTPLQSIYQKMAKLTRASFIVSFLTKPPCNPFNSQSFHPFSTTKTPFPLQYEMIITRPPQTPPHHRRRRPPPPPNSTPPDPQLGFDDWVDSKLSSESAKNQDLSKPMRKYYNKRRKRMYGSDSEDDGGNGNGKNENKYVELNQEVVKLRTLHKREEELYFYDMFAYPWEKDKHYKMVYQLEKKFFPDQCFDKAFLEPGQSNAKTEGKKKEEKGLVFFEEGSGEKEDRDVKMDVTEKKVEEFFKSLKKVPREDDSMVPFVSGRSSGLPPKWDGPTGAVLLVNKPKG